MNHPQVVHMDEINAAVARGIAQAQEVHKINDAKKADAGWRQELEELTARLTGLPTEDEAEARLSNLEAAVASQVKQHEARLAECRKALKTAFLSPLEATLINEKAERVAFQLADFRRASDMQLRFAKQLLETAKEWNPKRERWQELRQRAASIDKAIQV